MLGKRIASALVMAPVVLYAAYTGGALFTCLIAVASIAGVIEVEKMLALRDAKVSLGIGIAASVLITAAFDMGSGEYVLGALIASVLLAISWPVLSDRARPSDSQATLFAVIYVPLLFGYVILLRSMAMGAIALLLACTWGCDVLAYFVGKAFGAHKLSPRISPGKSWEGAVAGLVGSLASGWFVGPYAGLSPSGGLIAGLLLGVVGQVGDLAESALKRFAGVKDSGSSIPGHGGVLDRCDSLLFNAPALYYLMVFFLARGG